MRDWSDLELKSFLKDLPEDGKLAQLIGIELLRRGVITRANQMAQQASELIINGRFN